MGLIKLKLMNTDGELIFEGLPTTMRKLIEEAHVKEVCLRHVNLGWAIQLRLPMQDQVIYTNHNNRKIQ